MGMVWQAIRLDEADIAAARVDAEALIALFDHQEDPESDRILDIDKSWAGIHWLLTGSELPVDTDTPASSVIFGCSMPDKLVDGISTVILNPEEVATASEVMESISDEEFRSRLDLDAMAEADVYPSIWDEDEEEVFDEYLLEFIQLLRPFYHDAASAGEWVAIAIM